MAGGKQWQVVLASVGAGVAAGVGLARLFAYAKDQSEASSKDEAKAAAVPRTYNRLAPQQPELPVEDNTVLSIQSHVVRGYVGNRAAVFPLQLLGFDVSFINSVQFCAHTQYPTVTGQILGGEELEHLLEGLRLNGCTAFGAILTGYIGSTTFLSATMGAVDEVRRANPQAMYVCDPVLGDDGHMYVTPDLIPVYRSEVLPRATVLTPNQFEVELLTGRKISCPRSAVSAIQELHSAGVETVIMTSSELADVSALGPGARAEGKLVLIASAPWSRFAGSSSAGLWSGAERRGDRGLVYMLADKIDARFTGTGDVMASLLVAHLRRNPTDLAAVVHSVMATMAAICKRTLEQPGQMPPGVPPELRLVQSKADIEEPPLDATPYKPHALVLDAEGGDVAAAAGGD